MEQNKDQMFPQFQNGRVININEKPSKWYQPFDNNTADPGFAREALYGIQDCSLLSKVFFSKANQKLLQDMLRYEILKKSDGKYLIGEQSYIDLQIICRSMFLQHARHLPYKITEQVKELNSLCLNYMVPQVYSQTELYFNYLYLQEHNPIPIELPKNMSSAGTRLLRSEFSAL